MINQNLTTVNRTIQPNRVIKYIVLHYTGNKGDTAYGNTVYFKDINRGASAHYFVDEVSVWQCVEDKDIAWHCGTKGKYYHKECRNANSIGVEMCNSVTRNSAVESRTAELVRWLMEKYGIDANHVVRHYDVTHKKCPAPLVDENEWNDFKKRLEDEFMTEAEKAKIQAIDDTVTRLHGKVTDIDASLTNLYGIVQQVVDDKKVYNTIGEVPEWGKSAVQAAINKGAVQGDGDGLGLTYADVRAIVREWRCGVYG